MACAIEIAGPKTYWASGLKLSTRTIWTQQYSICFFFFLLAYNIRSVFIYFFEQNLGRSLFSYMTCILNDKSFSKVQT